MTKISPYAYVYYEIRKIIQGNVTEFVCVTDKEWIAKDLCSRYPFLTYVAQYVECKNNCK